MVATSQGLIRSEVRDKITAFAALTFFAVLIVALHAAYVSLDEQGYVPHESELLI